MPLSTQNAPSPDAIRTLALVGPTGTGKTTLAEALLLGTGSIPSAGSVERGNTVADFDPLARKHQHSLNSALLHLAHRDTRIHLIDTPGLPDFIGPTLSALEAVDTAMVLVNAAVGIEPGTRRFMEVAAQRGLDRLLVVTRIDTPGVDLAGLLDELREAFGKEVLPLNLPASGGQEVVDCWFAPAAQPGHEADFSSVAMAHRALVEQVVEVDAAFVERYLEEGDVDARELHAPLEQALREGHLIPVCFVSARQGAGVQELLDAIVELLPNPTEGNPPPFLRGEGKSAEPYAVSPDANAHVVAHVFKVSVDPYVGKLGVFRVHQGTLTRDSQLYIGDGRKPFKVGHVFLMQGKTLVEVPAVGPGELAAVAKVDDIHLDDVLHDAAEDEHLHLQPPVFPAAVHGLALEPKRHGDEQRLWELLQKLVAEDPCLCIEQVASTRETVVYGLGELHLRILLERLSDVHKFEVATRPPRIPYRESITAAAEGHHRHKKQTGGAGQFGEVFLRVEPLPRSAEGGSGFEFIDATKGGVIPQQFMPAVEKGVRQAMADGAIAGYPVIDVRVVVTDGKSHSVDSKEVAFVTAARKAFVAAVREAQPIVLEPLVELEITAADGQAGDISGDLSARRGQVNGTTPLPGGQILVRAQAPLAELSSYQSRLNTLTGGQGRYTMAFSRYDTVPPSVQSKLVAEHQVHDEE